MAANHGYRLSFFNWMFFALIGIFLTSPFMNLMSDTPFIVESGSSYMRIITIGSLFCIVQMTSEKILQATGNMIVPMICGHHWRCFQYHFRSVVHLRYRQFPELGVAGAGVATIGGQFLSMCVGQIVLFKGKHAAELAVGLEIQGQDRPGYLCSRCTGDFNAVHRIYHAVRHEHHSGNTNGNSCCRYGCIWRILQSFIFMPVFGLNQGVLPIMGFNYGARNRKRLMETYKKGLMIACIIMAIGLVAFQLFPRS